MSFLSVSIFIFCFFIIKEVGCLWFFRLGLYFYEINVWGCRVVFLVVFFLGVCVIRWRSLAWGLRMLWIVVSGFNIIWLLLIFAWY